ncbi:MAG: hypothetical protein WAW57_07320 [Lutibacter sp.]
MQKPFVEIEVKDVIFHPFEIPQPEGFTFPINFPNCCKTHPENLKLLESYLDIFPRCCEMHREFYKKFKFNKQVLYKDLPMRILRTIEYTEFQILKTFKNDDWLEDISEYIEYAIRSLGQPAIGYHIFLAIIESFIESKETKLPGDKKKAILLLFKEQKSYTPEKEKTNLNQLYTIYNRWLNFFPFDLPFYAHLKSKHNNSLPIIKEIVKPNRYLGLVTIKIITPSELVDFLYKKTVSMLSLIDTVALVKEGKIDNAEKTKLDFINQAHQHKQKMLLVIYNKGEKQYIKAIKEWLENEKVYFQDIVPIVNQITLPPIKVDTNKYFQIKDSATRYHKATSLFDKLVTKNYLEKECKPNFINAFTGTKPRNKVNWIGNFGDLKSFIKYCNSENLFYNNTDIWVVAAEVFTVKNLNITSIKIKDTKRTKDDYILKKLVESV